MDEDLDHYAQQIDNLVGRMDALIELQHAKNAITVTHTQSSNATFFVGIAVTACVATLALMLAFMIIENRSYTHLDNQVDQLKAWNDINRAKIAALEAKAKP